MTKKKIIVICLSAAFVIFAAAAVWFVSTLADKPSEKPDDTKEARQLIYTDEANLFESLTIKNANGEYTLIRDGDEIKVKGRENITLLPATSKAVFETFAEVYVVKTITENGTDGFGFDEPSAVLTLKKVDGTAKTMLVGDFAPIADICALRAKRPSIFSTATEPPALWERSRCFIRRPFRSISLPTKWFRYQ